MYLNKYPEKLSYNLNLDVVLYARDKVKNDYLLVFFRSFGFFSFSVVYNIV